MRVDAEAERVRRFASLAEAEMLRRNRRKSPAERVDSLMVALREVQGRGWWPQVDRKAKEDKLLCSLKEAAADPNPRKQAALLFLKRLQQSQDRGER